MRSLVARTTLIGLLVVAFVLPVRAQDVTSPEYRTPDQTLVDIVDALPTPGVSLSPDNEWMLLIQAPSLPSIAELAERELKLAGMRIKPQINGPSRTYPYINLSLMRVSDGEKRAISGLPTNPRLENMRWSPDGEWISFTNTVENGIELWVAEVASGQAKRLVADRLNLTMYAPPTWLSDSRTLVCTLVPEGRGAEPEVLPIPSGPVIQENVGKVAPARTYQDLLQNPYDEALFEHYGSAQLARVTVDGDL